MTTAILRDPTIGHGTLASRVALGEADDSGLATPRRNADAAGPGMGP